MVGDVLDASQQFFDGVRADDFTVAQLAAAEAKTIDVEDGFAVGDVFYKFFPTFAAFGLDDFDRARGDLFRGGLFSYAGVTVANDIQTNPFSFQVAEVNLSLLGAGNTVPAPGSNIGNFAVASASANQLANLAPAAGGTLTPEQMAELSPAAGGAAGNGNCGNSFLGSGFAPGFDAGSCSVE
jgi:hypothetical protein